MQWYKDTSFIKLGSILCLFAVLMVSCDSPGITSEQIPAGLYEERDIEIDADDVDAPNLNHDAGYYSVAAKGTFNEEEFRLQSPVEVSDTIISIMLNLSNNVDRWFAYADRTNPDANRESNEISSGHLRYYARTMVIESGITITMIGMMKPRVMDILRIKTTIND